MRKLIGWCKQYGLFVITLFLLAFIPLYPKLPLINVRNTWVYVRAEDFFVLLAMGIWAVAVIRKKVTLQTPLTIPIFVYWLIGGLATIHGVILIFPTVANVFSNVAFFSYLRRIEYMSLFFLAYSSIKEKRSLAVVFVVMVLTLLAVSLYGLGQKYLSFPAFLTMNEQFAKGIPIHLSALSRVPSTFGGQYDLAAYLVFVIPIVVSVMFCAKNWFVKIFLFAVAALSSYVLILTVSRISLFALLAGIALVLILLKQKRLIVTSIVVIAAAALVFIRFSPGIADRFGSTLKEVSVLVDATNGEPLGEVTFVPNTYFENKIIKQQFLQHPLDAQGNQLTINGSQQNASPAAAIIIPYTYLQPQVVLLTAKPASTGESLPQGTGYINLSLSPVTKKLNQFFYELKPKSPGDTIEVQIINGPYLVKRTIAYDVSFTTRFQGEWPNTLAAFQKNIFLGSGYGSVSLAVDNSYLRALGETGTFGLLSFAAIFILIGIYIKKVWRTLDSPMVKHFLVGFAGGLLGLGINAIFIDVFEASKVAFSLWLVAGVAMGTMHLYQKGIFDDAKELLRPITSNFAVIVTLFIITFVLFAPTMSNYFVGDDFTWFRWAADCGKQSLASQHCPITISTIGSYFTKADGFFYRPGTKIYFLFMYSIFWLNQNVYHIISVLLHFTVVTLVFFLAKRIFKGVVGPVLTAILFLMMSGYVESVFWISATGFLFTTCFSVASLLSFIRWTESKRSRYFVLTLLFAILSTLFHELGVITPLLYFVYLFTMTESPNVRRIMKNTQYWILLAPIPLYLAVRWFANSHWFGGDYSYNVLKFPVNAVGNILGYAMLMFIGPVTSHLYEGLRSGVKDHLVLGLVLAASGVCILVVLYRKVVSGWSKRDRQIVAFGSAFSVVSLLPFLGLGNIASRYSYMASIGVAILLVFLVKKMYGFLLQSGKTIAFTGVAVGMSVFCLLQIIQLQSMQDNWHEAGDKVQQFIVSIDAAYEDEWASAPMELHFVNTPIRNGEAWVFPVGVPDALWFIFRNPNMRVYLDSSLDQALNSVAYGSKTQKVFVFDATGAVTEQKKTRSTQ